MCNDYRSRVSLEALRSEFPDLRMPVGGAPNLEPREHVRITEPAPIIRSTPDGGVELVQMRWSWPGPGGKPVYNFRSEGRRFASGRCLIPTDGFFEFTDPPLGSPKRAKKTRWLFTMRSQPWFCIAGIWRAGAAEGADAWTMLTCPPGPEIAQYHSRQIVVLGRRDGAKWLAGDEPEVVLTPSPSGTLEVQAC